MAWKKGQSGNPNGRPKKQRTLAALMERALSTTMPDGDKRIARKRKMVQLYAQGVSEGKITFPDGREVNLEVDEYISLVKTVLVHIDGPAPAEHDVNLNGNLLIWDMPTPEPDSQS